MLKYIGYALVAIILVLLGYYLIIIQASSAPRTGDTAVAAEFANYHEGIQGYYAEPASGFRHPGIILVHSQWGLNDAVAAEAELLAREGYRVLAVDLFEGVVPMNDENAAAVIGAVDQARAIANLRAAAAYLDDKGASRIGILGWGYGGGQALQYAVAEDTDLDAIVVFYGAPLVTDAGQLGEVGGPVLGLFGESDQTVKSADVEAFRSALNVAGIDNEIHTYPGAAHEFADPGSEAYVEADARDAWQKTLTFLADHL